MTSTAEEVVLVGTWANLVPKSQMQLCRSWDEPGTCEVSVASADAFRRHYLQELQENDTTNSTKKFSSMVVSRLVTLSAFVQMHPNQWNVNHQILHEIMGFRLFTHTPSTLYASSVDYSGSKQNLTPLQDLDFPFLLTNVQVPPTNSWLPFWEHIHFDSETRIALMTVVDIGDPVYNVDPVEACQKALRFIHLMNQRNNCDNGHDAATDTCWIPVILLTDSPSFNPLQDVVNSIVTYQYPPRLIAGVEVDPTVPAKYPTLQKIQSTWVSSFWMDEYNYVHFHFKSSDNGSTYIDAAGQAPALVNRPLVQLPASAMDATYQSHVSQITSLANQALQEDRIVGYSQLMVDPRVGDNYRACQAGDCDVGSLFVDALYEQYEADVAFITSGGVREGWPAGGVYVKDLWVALPFPNTLCTGTMTGISLFRLLDHATRTGTFDVRKAEGASDLLQLPRGMRVTLNKNRGGQGEPKLQRIEIYDRQSEEWQDLQRLKLYKFATDSYVCSGAEPFYPDFLSSLSMPGEVKPTIQDIPHHLIVEEYMTSNYNNPLTPYQVGGNDIRLVQNDTFVEPDAVLNLIQTAADCIDGVEYWVEDLESCQICPDTSRVQWYRESMEFEGVAGFEAQETASVTLLNGAKFAVTVAPKALPNFVAVTWMIKEGSFASSDSDEVVIDPDITNPALLSDPFVDGEVDVNESVLLQPGDRLSLEFSVSAGSLEPGTASGIISFGVTDGGDYPTCQNAGQDASLNVIMRALPQAEMNHLGGIRWVGWSLVLVVLFAAFACGAFVVKHRKARTVMTMQPLFLVSLVIGIAIMGLTLIPLGVDDENFSERGCDMACMSIPWLISIGFSVTFSALFTKLWRINKLFGVTQFRRVQVREKDVILPATIIFSVNLITLLLLNVIDPLQWQRDNVDGQIWNTYGRCQAGAAGNTLLGVLGVLNVIALGAACYQAYKARSLSDEFSESRSIGVALYSWLQLLLVSVPIFLLLEEDAVDARYFLYVALVFAICMSMLTLIFYPVIRGVLAPRSRDNVHISGMNVAASGVSSNGSSKPSGLKQTLGTDSAASDQSNLTNNTDQQPPATMNGSSRVSLRPSQLESIEEGGEHSSSAFLTAEKSKEIAVNEEGEEEPLANTQTDGEPFENEGHSLTSETN